MKRPKQIPAANRRIVEKRSGGSCEGCSRRPATDIHHRKYKSRGGGHEVENLLALCGGPSGMAGGNHSGCHGVAHSGEGHELGWSCNTWETPADNPSSTGDDSYTSPQQGKQHQPTRRQDVKITKDFVVADHHVWRPEQKVTSYVYEVYDSSLTLVYVGMTGDFAQRWNKHKSESWWFRETTVNRVVVRGYQHRTDARRAEAEVINERSVPFNTKLERSNYHPRGDAARPAEIWLLMARVEQVPPHKGWERAYDAGFHDGRLYELAQTDLVAAHIDGRHDDPAYVAMSDAKYVPWMQKRIANGA